jgi:hypothetical protein
MTDEQIVSALITSYRNRGVDLSYLLSDPLFERLPIRSKIQAIQNHAEELQAGIKDGITSNDVKRMSADILFEGARGASVGGGLGAALAAAGAAGGITPLKGALLGAAVTGVTGGLLGAFRGYQGVGERRDLKTALKAVSEAPSPTNALGALSHHHATASDRNLKRDILSRVAEKLQTASTAGVNILVPHAHEIGILEHQLSQMN